MTVALEGGEWSAARPGHPLPPGKTWCLFYRRLGGPQGPSGLAENLVPTGIRSRTVQPVAQSLYRLSYRPYILSLLLYFNTDIRETERERQSERKRQRESYELERSRRGRIKAWLALPSSPTPLVLEHGWSPFPLDDPYRDRFTRSKEKAVVGRKSSRCSAIMIIWLRFTERPLY